MQRAAKAAALRQIFAQQICSPAADIDEEESNSDDELSDNSTNDIGDEQLQNPTSSSSDESQLDTEILPLRERIVMAGREQRTLLVSPSGQQWSRTPPGSGQRQSRNILRVHPGITCYAAARARDEESAFGLLFDQFMMETIIVETNRYAYKVKGNRWKAVDQQELKTFIGLCILRGVYRAHGECLNELWSVEHGRKIFRQTMSLNRFKEIQSSLRFDNPETRQSRQRNDKLAAIRLILDSFTQNSQKCYMPGEAGVTIDEQLYPFRGRCRFIQYIPSKPAKYGLKFWALNDSATSYCWNIEMYTGKDENRDRPLGEHVVINLSKNLQGSGIGITVDNSSAHFNWQEIF